MSDGPWRVDVQWPNGRCQIKRPYRPWAMVLPNVDAAERKCAELNKIARREAASEQLLTMCRLTTKALSEYLRDGKPPEDVSFILAEAQRVIRAAEGEES